MPTLSTLARAVFISFASQPIIHMASGNTMLRTSRDTIGTAIHRRRGS